MVPRGMLRAGFLSSPAKHNIIYFYMQKNFRIHFKYTFVSTEIFLCTNETRSLNVNWILFTFFMALNTFFFSKKFDKLRVDTNLSI